MDKKLLGKRIKKARKELGMTSDQLAELCYINATYLRQIECGLKLPSLPLFVLLSETLHVSPSWLLADQVPTATDDQTDTMLKFFRSLNPSQVRMISKVLQSIMESNQSQEDLPDEE